jgi:phosphoribosylamine--glycine ligase
MSNKRVLVIGSGGREYAFAWKLYQDEEVEKVFCAPGNGGTERFSTNLDLDVKNHQEVLDVIRSHKIDLTLIGPEAPLADGIVDFLSKNNTKVFGPDKYASQLESSKLFARDVMDEYDIPQPRYKRCNSKQDVIDVKNTWGLPLVIKADGLAAGKGVIICADASSFDEALKVMFDNPIFGDASNSVSVEECLFGEELSIFAVCDGDSYQILNTAQDHKRAFDGDKGPNTGGMGAYSPTPLSTQNIISKTENQIIQPILDAMRDKGHPYKGFLYVGIMIVENNPFVIEFNVRMGDPETQAVIPLLRSSFYRLLDDCLNGELNKTNLEISPQTAVAIVLASDGYPSSYQRGMEIDGINESNSDLVFHAGTRVVDGKLVASGGRVLNVVGFGNNLREAIDKAYKLANEIDFEGKFFRADIGKKGLSYK